MPQGTDHPCRGVLWALWLGCAWNWLAAAAAAQVFQVQGGSSSLYQATGGGLKVYTQNYEGQFGLGNAQGWKAGGSLKTQRFGHVLGLGDDMMHLELPTDIFDGSRYAYTRGLSLARKGKRGSLLGFAGMSSDIFSTPFFKAARADQPLGMFIGDYRVQPGLRAFTRNAFSREINSLHGVEWQASRQVLSAVTGGVLASRPYLASSLNAEKSWASIKASYVLATRPRARRVIASTASSSSKSKRRPVADPNASQANKENVLLNFYVKPYLTLAAGRQNFLQADAAQLSPLAAAVNHFGVSMNLSSFQIGGNFYDSRTESYRNLGTAVNVTFPVTDRVRVISSYFRSAPSGSPAFNTLALTLQETVTPYLGLSQLATRTGGRTTVAFGGSLLTNFLKVSAEWQTFFVPFRRGNQFKQALVLRFELRLFGDTQLQGGTDIAPDGSVRYTSYGSSFLYHQGIPQVHGPALSFPKYLLQGQVADENGNPIAGAALRLGREEVFTDSGGRFFLRVRKAGPHRLEVVFENFLAPGSYALVSAPSEVTADGENHAPEISVIVRRLVNPPAASPKREAPLLGTLAGFVKLHTMAESAGAADVWVVLDSGRIAKTDANGYFQIPEVPQGPHVVALDMARLPAGFHPTQKREVHAEVRAGQLARMELEVTPLQSLEGIVLDRDGYPPAEGVVIHLLPTDHYTTTDRLGRFGFYNLPEGDYVATIIEDSLPDHATLVTPNTLPVMVRYGAAAVPVLFRYVAILPGPKPVKNVSKDRQQTALHSVEPRTKEPPSRKRRVIARTIAQHNPKSPVRRKRSSCPISLIAAMSGSEQAASNCVGPVE